MIQEFYDEEMMLKEAITSQMTDKEIGMPDIEAELLRVKQESQRHGSMTLKMVQGRLSLCSSWIRVAAIVTIIITMSGLSWAYFYYQKNKTEDAVAKQSEQLTVNNEKLAVNTTLQDTTMVGATEYLTLSYEKASLEQIVTDLSAYYHLDKPVFAEQMAARKYLLHVTFNQKGTIQDAIGVLNNFGRVQITLVDNRLIVDK